MKRVFILGQALPRTNPERPFGRTALYKWLQGVGVTEDHIAKAFYFGALVDYFPGAKKGSHLAPTPAQILQERPRLLERIRQARPEVIMPVGTLAIREVLNDPGLSLGTVVGKVFTVDPFGQFGQLVTVIPLPHPSGASPWVHLPGNKELLAAALQQVGECLRD